MHRRALLALVPLFALRPARAASLPAEAAVAALRQGGLNVYMRHAITDRSQRDSGRLGDRAGQRNLSERGRAQAVALGQALRALSIPVGQVFTSAVFRASDTAALAFPDRPAVVLDALVADDYTPRHPADDAAAVVLRLQQPPGAGNEVHVGHIVPFGMMLGRSLAQEEFPEGSLGLVRPLGHRFELIGIVAAEALIRAAGLTPP
jgi:phosphohistidine phosphatase SixA